jgi:hypothetical protein
MPIKYREWKGKPSNPYVVPDSVRDQLWNDVLKYFALPEGVNTNLVKGWTLVKMCQILQAQQRMTQQLQQMPPMQQKLRPSKPCSPKIPTQNDINAIVGATQLLEGQNSMLNQMVYDIIQGRYGEPSQTSLADSLSQSLSASMVEQARLFNLLVEYVNQDQPQVSDSILPLSQLPMNLRKEDRAIRGNKRVLSAIDVSEWEITCKETRPREGKRRCDTSKAQVFN